jgi:hypothetical protein
MKSVLYSLLGIGFLLGFSTSYAELAPFSCQITLSNQTSHELKLAESGTSIPSGQSLTFIANNCSITSPYKITLPNGITITVSINPDKSVDIIYSGILKAIPKNACTEGGGGYDLIHVDGYPITYIKCT